MKLTQNFSIPMINYQKDHHALRSVETIVKAAILNFDRRIILFRRSKEAFYRHLGIHFDLNEDEYIISSPVIYW